MKWAHQKPIEYLIISSNATVQLPFGPPSNSSIAKKDDDQKNFSLINEKTLLPFLLSVAAERYIHEIACRRHKNSPIWYLYKKQFWNISPLSPSSAIFNRGSSSGHFFCPCWGLPPWFRALINELNFMKRRPDENFIILKNPIQFSFLHYYQGVEIAMILITEPVFNSFGWINGGLWWVGGIYVVSYRKSEF